MKREAGVSIRVRNLICAATLGTAAIATLPNDLAGQQVSTASLEGRVRDQGGGAIAGAVVQLRRSDAPGVIARESNAMGHYRIEGIPAGSYEVSVRRLGYHQDSLEVVLVEARTVTLDFTLAAVPVTLEGIQVRVDVEQSRERARFEELAGATRRELAVAEMKLVPGMGEADPIRAVEVLPGVVSTSDFTAAFNVRGGSADQNLILLDGLQIFNPFHLGGFFSVFNADMVERAELLSGGFRRVRWTRVVGAHCRIRCWRRRFSGRCRRFPSFGTAGLRWGCSERRLECARISVGAMAG